MAARSINKLAINELAGCRDDDRPGGDIQPICLLSTRRRKDAFQMGCINDPQGDEAGFLPAGGPRLYRQRRGGGAVRCDHPAATAEDWRELS